jgi:TM2 domain-containing membrane protein YozV
MRTTLLACALFGFAGLGVMDLLGGRTATGIAALLLATANWLLLT